MFALGGSLPEETAVSKANDKRTNGHLIISGKAEVYTIAGCIKA